MGPSVLGDKEVIPFNVLLYMHSKVFSFLYRTCVGCQMYLEWF